MILLDTDHLSVLEIPEAERTRRLRRRLDAVVDEEIGTTIISVEEQMRGWLAAIAKERKLERQISPYRHLADLFMFFSQFAIILFEEPAVDHFASLRSIGIRIGTMDLKIASICLSYDALLLTANSRDFSEIPALRFENWLDE